MSAILKQLSGWASALDPIEDKSSNDGNAPDTCTDHVSHQVFTPSVFKVGTDAEGEFTFNYYKGELIKPHLRASNLAIQENSWREHELGATFIHRKIVDLTDQESEFRRGIFEGDRDTAQQTWLHYSKVWSQAQQARVVPSGSTVAPSSTSASQKPGSNALPPID